MQLIKKELEENIEQLNSVASYIEEEHNFCNYIIQRERNIEGIPTDTLIKYQNIAFQVISLPYSSDALEALKTSALIPEINNKDLAFQLIQTYKALENRSIDIENNYILKAKAIDKLTGNEKFFNMRIYSNMPIHELWKNYMQNFHFKAIIYFSNGNFYERCRFTYLKDEITKTIATIDKEYN